MPAPKRFDLVILGSGSTAFAAALRAGELGKTSLMTEERVVGGTCVNRGCPPSKNPSSLARCRRHRNLRCDARACADVIRDALGRT